MSNSIKYEHDKMHQSASKRKWKIRQKKMKARQKSYRSALKSYIKLLDDSTFPIRTHFLT